MAFLRQFSFWVVGDGSRICTWMDNWVPGRQSPPIPASNIHTPEQYNHVSDLIDQETKTWKEEIVQSLFMEEDATKILQINIQHCSEDRLMWTLTRNGVFSVKSAYRKLVEMKNANSIFDEEAARIWKKIWAIPTLPKVKHFLWKCMIDIVPSNERMARVMGYTGDQCKMCQNGIETTKHLLWECSFSRAVWTTRPGARRSMLNPDTSIQEWIKSWFSSEFSALEDDWIVKMANTAWEIWKERCKCVFDDARPNPVGVIKSIELLNAVTGKKMVEKSLVTASNSGTSINKWMPPTSPYYSICCDASFKSVNNVVHSGWGLICRDFAGQFIRAECTYTNGILNAEEAECKGLIQAMQVAENLELQMVCFELDAKLVIKAVNGDMQAVAWQNQVLILEIRSFLGKHPLWVCKFLGRKFNKPADRLARHARTMRVSNTWYDYPPNFIASVILEEATNYVHNHS